MRWSEQQLKEAKTLVLDTSMAFGAANAYPAAIELACEREVMRKALADIAVYSGDEDHMRILAMNALRECGLIK